MNWFICKISYEKMMENGMLKKVTEPYLVDSLSFTEAEARIIEEMKPCISGEFSIADISRYKVSEVFFIQDTDKWFLCKLNFITLDERSGSEKKTPINMLVQSSSIDSANKTLVDRMRGTIADYEIEKIAETKIVDVFTYKA